MKSGHNKHIIVGILVFAFLFSSLAATTVKAQNFNFSDDYFSYFSLTNTPDVVKQGDVVTSNLTVRLASHTHWTFFNLTYYVNTSNRQQNHLYIRYCSS